MKQLAGILLFVIAVFFAHSQEVKWEGESIDFSHGKLKVSENKRFLVFEDGTPFFWLGDTAWELFHRLTKEETEKYLENRREKGFTVIQAVILAEIDGLNTPNMEGNKPLIDNDPTKINEAYFSHVDWVIKKAEEKGLFIGLLPTWGDKVYNKNWGIGPVIFNEENASEYGKIIANRYKDFKNIIWINGGDRNPTDSTIQVWNALGEAINNVDDNHLITFHPQGGKSSSFWFHNEDWQDFNMMQTGHSERSYAIYKSLLVPDYQKQPAKPTFDGEPRYEDHPVQWLPEIMGWFDDVDVRQAAYWNLFSGGFGHTYGCHAIWQMLTPDRDPIGFGRHTWYVDLDLPGAWDMLYVRKLMESRPFLDRIPFQEIIMKEYMPETDYIVATRGEDYVMVYFPSAQSAKIDLNKCGWDKAKIWWFNVKTGEVTEIGVFNTNQVVSYGPDRTNRRGDDMVLVIDNAAKNFGPPGKL